MPKCIARAAVRRLRFRRTLSGAGEGPRCTSGGRALPKGSRGASAKTEGFRVSGHSPSTQDGVPARGIPDSATAHPAPHLESMRRTPQGPLCWWTRCTPTRTVRVPAEPLPIGQRNAGTVTQLQDRLNGCRRHPSSLPAGVAAASIGRRGGRAAWQKGTHEVAAHEHATQPRVPTHPTDCR